MNSLSKYISIKSIVAYCINFILCIFLLIIVLQLWNADLTIPFSNNGDTIAMQMWIKGIIDNGWWYQNQYLGMPFGQENYDFPLSNFLDLGLIKFLGLLTHNSATTMNLFFLLTFPLTAITTMFVFRQFEISYGCSIVGSQLFTFIPYHFLRAEPHIFLSSYFLIPLGIMVVLWTMEDRALIFDPNNNKFELLNKKMVIPFLICIFVAFNVYYAFFTCFLFLISGIILGVSKKNKNYLINSIFYISIIVCVLLLVSSSSLIYQYQNGNNQEAIYRFPADAEIFGLKIAQLFLPISGHRIPFFAEIAEKYSSTAPLVNENSFASIGIVGSAGFLMLISWVLFRTIWNQKNALTTVQIKFNNLGLLNISAVLLATIGGFGSIMAYLVFYDIRAYNRISIFIAFFSIFFIFLIFDTIFKKYANSDLRKFIFFGFIGFILIFGIFDQTTPNFIPDYANNKLNYFNDDQFISQIESTLPKGSMIFQLPYVQYLGWGPSSSRLPMYSHANAYLHSKNLRWSYGAMVNRKADLWQRSISEEPIDEMIKKLSISGFDGIYLDSFGYPDCGIGENTALSSILETKPLISKDARYYFFNMSAYNQKIKTNFTQEEFENEQKRILNPIIIRWIKGFYTLESNNESNWRYGSSEGEIEIINPYENEQTLSIETRFVTGYYKNSNMTITGDIISEKLIVNNSGTVLRKTLEIPPGKHLVKISSDSERIYAPMDPRYLVYAVGNFRCNADNFVICK